eukprot:gene14308-294_t
MSWQLTKGVCREMNDGHDIGDDATPTVQVADVKLQQQDAAGCRDRFRRRGRP